MKAYFDVWGNLMIYDEERDKRWKIAKWVLKAPIKLPFCRLHLEEVK